MVDASTILKSVLEEVSPRRSILEEGEPIEIVGDKVTRVGRELEQEMKVELIACLKQNADIFARDIHDLTRIDWH